MNLRTRFTLILVFVIMIPMLLPLTGYLYFRSTIPQSEVRQITAAPPSITRDLHRIVDGTIAPDEIDERILIVLFSRERPIYLSPAVERFLAEEGLLDSQMEQKPEKGLEVLSAIGESGGGIMIGSAIFSYRGEVGVVFFRFYPENPLLFVARHPLTAATGLFILLVLTPLFFSSRFLFSLRRSLESLERSAERISIGDLDAAIELPADPVLQPVFRAFDAMRQELKEDQQQQARFLMSVSHDLKTPITTIRGFIEAMQDGVIPDDEERSRYYGIIHDKTDLLEERINELIETTRISTSGWQRGFAGIEVDGFLREISARYRIEAEARVKRFSSGSSVEPGTVIMGDRKMLTRAIENLIENAIRYGGPEAEVHLESAVRDGYLRISVEDSGPGISAADRPLLFEAFYRGDRGRNSRGMGLGLTSVKSIAEAHGGSAGVTESSLGGAGIYFEVPVVSSSDEESR